MMMHTAPSPNRPSAAAGRTGLPARPAGGTLQGAERQLSEAVERAARHPAGKLALVLHLSRLPAPRDYHVRVARLLLQDCAQFHRGQVFAMRNRDLVLLCTQGPPDRRTDAHGPAELPASLARLFAVDVPDSRGLTSSWRLDGDTAPLHAYLDARGADAAQPSAAETGGQPVSLAALQEIVAKAPLPGLMVQQTGLSLSAERSLNLAARLAAAFQAISIDLGGLNLDAMVQHAVGDPFLFRHFGAGLDLRLLAVLHDDLATRGKLLRQALSLDVPVLLELGLATIVSSAFAAFARLAAGSGLRLWIAVALPEAGASLALLDHARNLLRLGGCNLLLRVDPAAFTIIRPAALQADMVVVPWSARLRQSASGLDDLRAGLDARLVLTGVDGEAALAWGQAHGIDLFAGPYLDQVQAALRMQRCHSAGGCTLTQCTRRAAAFGPPGRSFCANPALLAAGFAA